jgi:hypothetical protein
VFLQKNYGDLHNLDNSKIALQFAAITDELTKMVDIDVAVTPVDEGGNNSPNQTHLDNDEESYDSDTKFTDFEEDFDNE